MAQQVIGDEASCRHAGIPAVFYGSGEADSYHSPDDIEPMILAQRGGAILETVILLSQADWAFIRGRAR